MKSDNDLISASLISREKVSGKYLSDPTFRHAKIMFFLIFIHFPVGPAYGGGDFFSFGAHSAPKATEMSRLSFMMFRNSWNFL